ncbi:putative NADH-quinone oxidoreductase, subunit M [Nitrospira japonica]|uniref:Putative NADH-quinone oxidoreductase, subunit M n=2 Tax=Nitrospira japonica TaxID=1325564 RepID=A0A1W1I2C4_9BACT|nr:putative NADH-quinone oxidoreductase, subunit M [Nitrospira japonica]
MTGGMMIPSLLAGIPLLGALASLPFRSDPEQLKRSCVTWAVLSLASIAGCANRIEVPTEGLLPLYLLPLAATISILGQPVHEQHRLSWLSTLVFLGIGLSVLSGPPLIAPLTVALLSALIAGLLYQHHSALWPRSWWGIGAYGFGALCAALSAAVGDPLSSLASLLACGVLLPLLPFHDGYLTALTRLPGSLPSFIVVLLPLVGLHLLAAAMPTVSDSVAWTVGFFALAGASYGAFKALAQSRVRLLLAYGSLSFFSIFWWFAAASRTATPRAALLVGTVGLATSGLMVAWQVVRTRYGDDVDPQAISGLATGMPQYAVLLSLLALAAMGLPPFGVFAGFMGLLLGSPFPSLAGLFVTLLAWLAASWYIMQMVQRLLFGIRRPELRYTDLLQAELASLLIVVLVLLALGLVPSTLFASEPAALGIPILGESFTWNR